MAVEFVIAAPLLVLMMLVIALGGEWLDNTSQVGAAARDAVRAASDEVDWSDVQSVASATAGQDLSGVCTSGLSSPVLQPADGAAWPTAPAVEVRVTCTVNMSAFGLIRVPISETFTSTAVAPLDPFSFRSSS
jgi:Flp pilus assembly protein TadG